MTDDTGNGAAGVRAEAVKDLHIAFLLDRTGSMQAIRDPTIGTFNEFLASQRALPARTRFTLVQFDSESTDVLYDNADIAEVAERGPWNYVPRAMTPLWDAVGQLIVTTEAARWDGDVLCVVQTDGCENHSREWTAERVKENITRLSAAGWEFMFLGAGLDDWAAEHMGFSPAQIMTYGRTTEGQQVASALKDIAVSEWRMGARAKAMWFAEEKAAAERTKPAQPRRR